MRMWAQSHLCQKPQRVSSVLAAAFALIFLILGASQSASALPAFARKYGLRCSACHESLADAELLRPEVQGQRLSAHERSRFSDLAESRLLAGHFPHHADLAPRQPQQGRRR